MRKGDTFDAKLICQYGRELNYEESFLRLYYNAKDEWEEAVMTGKRSLHPWRVKSRIKSGEDFEKIRKSYEQHREVISQVFMQAVDTHDVERILNLANAIWFFQEKRHSRDHVPADRERILLLFLKTILNHIDGKIPIRLVAQFLRLDNPEARKNLKTPADGFSALRRKCIQMGIPLAESRKTSRK